MGGDLDRREGSVVAYERRSPVARCVWLLQLNACYGGLRTSELLLPLLSCRGRSPPVPDIVPRRGPRRSSSSPVVVLEAPLIVTTAAFWMRASMWAPLLEPLSPLLCHADAANVTVGRTTERYACLQSHPPVKACEQIDLALGLPFQSLSMIVERQPGV